MSTQIIERVNIFDNADVEPDIHEDVDLGKVTHFISPAMNAQLWAGLSQFVGKEISSKELVSEAIKRGWELEALCGFRWVPTGTGDRNPVCEACLQIAQRWIAEDGR